jgi:Holliday junction resolvase RusA-like endonuclease
MIFEVPGEPRGKGRPRFNRQQGHTYTDSETKAYEQKIVAYYRKTFGSFKWPDNSFVAVKVIAYYPIPKSATKAAKAAMQEGKTFPSRKPDIDNVLKVVLDALNSVAYKDDARVVSIQALKRYSFDPRLQIEINEGSD